MSPTYIAGMGYHHPQERITNADLEKIVDTSDRWIREHTGIVERRGAPDGVDTSHLGVIATQRALESAGCAANELDLLICATSSPDQMLPAAACHIARELRIDPIAFDVNAACSGFTYALAVARSMMEDMGYRRVALCCADKYTRFTDYTDRRSCILFGDSAATVLLQKEKPARGAEVVDLVLSNAHEGIDLVSVPVGGYWQLDGHGLKAPAVEMLVAGASALLARHDLKIQDIRAVMGHQANYRLLEAVAATLGVSEEQHWSNVRMMGNQGASGVLTTFCAGVEKRSSDLRDGDLFLLTVVGAGLTSGCALLRWIESP